VISVIFISNIYLAFEILGYNFAFPKITDIYPINFEMPLIFPSPLVGEGARRAGEGLPFQEKDILFHIFHKKPRKQKTLLIRTGFLIKNKWNNIY